jgi:Arylsulfotransferase (ASST)
MSSGRPLALACRALLLAAALLSASLLAGASPASARASLPQVSVFPIPGDMVASPQTQIAFRGIPSSQLGTIQVTGSRSGVHTGTIEADSDGDGGSFVPSQPFVAGESVTVKTSLNILKAAHFGVFHFSIATPAGVPAYAGSIRAPRVPGDVWTFHSQPNLTPAAVTISRRGAGGGSADVFLTPQYGPLQNGPEIVSPSGQLIWFDALPAGNMASDFEVQQYHGQPVLTWWQGYSAAALGVGADEIYNTSYQPVATVHAANGLSADLHEFQITPQGTALITSYFPVYWNATAVHGSKRQIVYDCVVQEIDIPTGLVLFQWDSLDHVPITGSYTGVTRGGGAWDYFHLNSIQQDDGNYLISARNTWAAYKINSHTGAVMWSLGGKWSNFRMERGASFAFQHDVEDQSGNDAWITVFDDGGGLPNVHSQSRGLDLWLNFRNHTAWVGSQWFHSPALMADFEGNVQQISAPFHFIGWGERPYFTEYDRRGRVILDGHFISQTASYRAYRFPWSGTPSAPPALVGSAGGGQMTLYMSWNGATNVASWRILGGASAGALQALETVPDSSFETSATVPQQQYAEVQALDSHGDVLGTSAAVNIG